MATETLIPPTLLLEEIASGRFSPALLEKLSDEDFELLEQQLFAEIDARCAERIVSHASGPMYWGRTWTRTKNYHWQQQGLEPSAPFPYCPYAQVENEHPEWDYLDWTMHFILNSDELYIPKTREMMTSWLVVLYITWACQFFPNTQAVAQSEKDNKAMGLIEYANVLYDNQPDWLRRLHPLKRGTSGTQHEIEWANGSKFTALPQGERQVASEHPTIYFNDESAHQPAWKGTLNIVKPVARQIICVSSAAASDFGNDCDPSLAV
jgi:hypothetical protein